MFLFTGTVSGYRKKTLCHVWSQMADITRCLLSLADKFAVSLLLQANVKFACLTKANIRAYAATKEPFDKARAYHFQGVGGQLLERLDKEFFTVIGLPMHRFSQEISVTTESLNTYLRLQ